MSASSLSQHGDQGPKAVRKLAAELLERDDAVEAASLGEALLLRIIHAPLLPAVWDSLLRGSDGSRSDRPLP
jgi:hypothetical protein